uniref:Uncharacterized protein n=1 Tax=Malurus cyaneus samueli TaxID=2593467 RepID=A0A8C5TS84_9PASS
MRACSGRQPIMHTIMAGKMEMVLPAMYMMNRFMGICFSGARATSQQRCRDTRMARLWGPGIRGDRAGTCPGLGEPHGRAGQGRPGSPPGTHGDHRPPSGVLCVPNRDHPHGNPGSEGTGQGPSPHGAGI